MSLLLTLASFAPAFAQLDPGFHEIFQDGRHAGWAYVPEGQDACTYVEHWFLESGFQYPTLRNGLDLTVRPASGTYTSAERFVAAMLARDPNGTWVEAASVESRAGCR